MVLFLMAFVFSLIPPGDDACGQGSSAKHKSDSLGRCVVDAHGAVIRGDRSKAELSLVLTGDTFADGGAVIRSVLRQEQVKASFFFTGNFYANPDFRQLIQGLREDGHYLGAHSDKHLLYADWNRRDSVLVTEAEFRRDLLANYEKMAGFGVQAADAPFFLPPYEWYNSTIAHWTAALGLRLVNFTPGTRSPADYTYPQMGDRYWPSDRIYQSVIDREESDPDGLNGFILLVHIGTDPRRSDKFYLGLGELIRELKARGYRFVPLADLLKSCGP